MAIERLVDELDRSYAEAQERMSDPAVYNDHRQAADGGRRLKELETPKRLADEWREAKENLEVARSDPGFADEVPELEAQIDRLEGELSARARRARPRRREGCDRRDQAGCGRR